jgi:TolB-like protein/tetratricopeptide (TPR) repeat protein/predicted Ser/Thr protein kinase
MDPERWRKIEELYQLALEQEPSRRGRFLAEACRDDAQLREEVKSLLAQSGGTERLVDKTAWAQADDLTVTRTILTPGARLGPYQILGLLGEGGMGKVYRGFDPRLGRAVAIKISAEQFSNRFEREARAISALNHPHICTIYDVGPNYMVTELVEGETLRDWLKHAPAVERSLAIARQVLEALGAAHRAGIVHRDLKPQNIMVRPDGYVKVLDFGLAKRMAASRIDSTVSIGPTLPGQIFGTIAYMSPEQMLGEEVDQRSDLFSFGIILYEMLTGKHPWIRRASVDTQHAILHDDPPPMELTFPYAGALASIVQKLLCKSAAERYPLAEAVLGDLASCTASQGSAAATPVSPKPLTSIAVLPFVFLNEIEERQALSLGFADALITMLGSLEDFTVLPTSAILNYAAGTEPAQTCRNLGVRHVLQGNVQRLGSHWRVSMQLFDGMTQKIAYSEKHDFVREDVFEVQDEIGRRVVEALQTRFPRTVRKSRDRYSSDPEAFDEFMAGLRESYSGRRETIESAIQHLSSSVERDPEFALAHATLSYMCTNMHFQFDPQRTWIEKAEDHCERAMALDPALPEGHLARSWILWSPEKNFQHADAIAALEQVLAGQPNLERAHNRMSTICWHIGRMEEARIAHELARRSNPKTKTQNLEFIDLYSGNFARAEEGSRVWLGEAPESPYALTFSVTCALFIGDLELAGQRMTGSAKHHQDDPLFVTLQGLLCARRNQIGPALECARKALDSPGSLGHIHHAYHQIAGIYALLGDTEKAMAWLERTVDTGFPCWSFFRIDPNLESLRDLPAFQTLIASLERKYTALKIRRL